MFKRDDLVKIFSLKSDNCALTLQKRLFCNVKPTLLPCKTAAFGMQNNRFCNALITSKLHNSYACEKYLHSYRLIPVHKTRKILSVYGVGQAIQISLAEALFIQQCADILLVIVYYVVHHIHHWLSCFSYFD